MIGAQHRLLTEHLLSVIRSAQFLEFQDWAAPILQEPVIVTKGLAQTPAVPGMGLTWNEEMVSRTLV